MSNVTEQLNIQLINALSALPIEEARKILATTPTYYGSSAEPVGLPTTPIIKTPTDSVTGGAPTDAQIRMFQAALGASTAQAISALPTAEAIKTVASLSPIYGSSAQPVTAKMRSGAGVYYLLPFSLIGKLRNLKKRFRKIHDRFHPLV